MTSARGSGEGVGKSWRPNIGGRGLKPNVWDHFGRVAERWKGGGEGSGLLISDADVIFDRPLNYGMDQHALLNRHGLNCILARASLETRQFPE